VELVLDGDNSTNVPYFVQFQEAIDN